MDKKVINEVDKILNTSPEKLWNAIRTGENVHLWLPLIQTCELQGEGLGAKRVCTTDDGSSLEETITNIDDKTKTFEYTVDSHTMQIAATNFHGKMTIKDDNGKARLNWTVTFNLTTELDEATIDELQTGMKNSMKDGFLGLELIAN